jgi:hypothetical protein
LKKTLKESGSLAHRRSKLFVISGGCQSGPQISQLELSECVVLNNEIRLLRANLKKKRAYIRKCLRQGMEVEQGALSSYATQIANGRFFA